MLRLSLSIRDRLKTFLCAHTFTTEAYPANTDPPVLKVENAQYLNVWFFMRDLPQAFIKDKVTGKIHKVKIKEVDQVANTITLNEPISEGINAGSLFKRGPNYEEIRDSSILLGDPDIIAAYPAICVVPQNKSNEWLTVPAGTNETFNLNIIVHVKEDNQENSMISLMRITEDIEDLLKADLHLKIKGREVDYPQAYNRVYNSMVTQVDYGVSVKNEFLKSARITWFGTEFWWRFFLAIDGWPEEQKPFP